MDGCTALKAWIRVAEPENADWLYVCFRWIKGKDKE
jgi:hypothetical protein